MTKEMIISSSAHETRVAILEDDQVAEIFIERERSRGVVGNLYKGRVSKVLPGMQSAFVDLGLERDGFLYVTDVIATFEEFDRLETDDQPLEAQVGRLRAQELVRVRLKRCLSLLLREGEAHHRLVTGEGQIDDLSDAELDPAADEDLV